MKKGMSLFILTVTHFSIIFANTAIPNTDLNIGKQLYQSRCAMCHGIDAKATGPLAQKSNPSTPDLTTTVFKKRLTDYPGVIVAAVVLRPNGTLIPNTLRENDVKLPDHTWTGDELRALKAYMLTLIFPKHKIAK